MKVAITTDWLNSFGGAERVLVELHRMFPEAPIYTSVYDPSGLPDFMQGWDVRTSFLQKVPFARRRHRWLLPLMPLAFEQFDLREYDLVITTNSACAKGVITRPNAVNVCYCHTPCRYIWDLYHEYTAGRRGRAGMALVAHWLRVWDRLAADRVDHFVANSHEVARRIGKHYRRQADVIHPPVDVERFAPNGLPAEDIYLVVSRLVPYKRVDLAIEACNRLGRRLLVVGEGPERKRLVKMAGPTIEFLGQQDDATLADLYARCRALIFPGLEDFGIVPVEVQAAGRPVVAYGRGGAAETVIDGVTGVLLEEQTVEEVTRGIRSIEARGFDPNACRRNAERFGAHAFRAGLGEILARSTASDLKGAGSTGSGAVARLDGSGKAAAAPAHLFARSEEPGRARVPDATPEMTGTGRRLS
jgi:glycosyltransferase involved in cell wall biosynthesis